MPRFRGILLDFYGTLVHEDDAIISSICEAMCQSASQHATPKEIGQFWSDAFVPLCHRSYGRSFITQREAALQSLSETVRHFDVSLDPKTLIAEQFVHWTSPPIFPDTRPFLDYVAMQRLPVCIVSNIDRADIEQAIRFHDFRFEHLVTSDDARAYKPRPEIFEAALNTLGLGPRDVLHIGDSRTSDVAGAQRVGITAAWINRFGKASSGEMQPGYTVQSLDDLQAIVETGRA